MRNLVVMFKKFLATIVLFFTILVTAVFIWSGITFAYFYISTDSVFDCDYEAAWETHGICP